jgi:hypothetical protein
MRTALLLSVGMGAMVVGLLVRYLRRKPSRDDAGVLSGQWIADQSAKSDQTWP